MKKFLKITLWVVLSLSVLAVAATAVFAYKMQHGFPVSYETEAPAINFPADRTTVLIFSKSTGYRHEEFIETGKKVFAELAGKNNWFFHSTEEGGVFNAEQLVNHRL